jgi:hypothetical protein
LTRQNTEYWYSWGTEQDAAFEKLKQELSSETVMTYFNPKLYINIYVDAIPVGLGEIMSPSTSIVGRSKTTSEMIFNMLNAVSKRRC